MLKKLKRTPWVVMIVIGFIAALFAPTIVALVTKVSPEAAQKFEELSGKVNSVTTPKA